MADAVWPVPRSSPLTDAADRLAAVGRETGGALELAELPFLARIGVRLDPKGAAADAVGPVLGLQLPVETNTVVRAGNPTALWLGPDEWLVLGPPGSQQDLESRIREVAGDAFVSVTDVSPQRPTLLVEGHAPVTCWRTAARWICTRVPSGPEAARRPTWPAHRSRWSLRTNRRMGSRSGSVPPSPAV